MSNFNRPISYEPAKSLAIDRTLATTQLIPFFNLEEGKRIQLKLID
jgi:hypothetical protein